MGPQRASIREHFLAPVNAGRPPAPSGVGRAENRVCGDTLEVFVLVAEGRVRALHYLAQGCSALGATASLVSEHVAGLAVDAALGLDVSGLVARCGGLPPSKGHAPRVVQRALREALADHHSRCHP